MKAYRLIIIFLVLFSNIFGQKQNSKLEIFHLTGNFYVYTTYGESGDGLYPSNSMYLLTENGVVLFDTPWDTTQFKPLLDSIESRHHQKVVLCISTHFHADRTAGLEYYKQHGIKTFSSQLTYELCKQRNQKQSEFYFTKDTLFKLGSYTFETFYPGEGHTKDNIVVWFPKEKILYGGCLIKSADNNDIGYIGDANLLAWAPTMKNLISRFPEPEYVIPGHLDWHNNQSLKHTLLLVEEYNKKNPAKQ